MKSQKTKHTHTHIHFHLESITTFSNRYRQKRKEKKIFTLNSAHICMYGGGTPEPRNKHIFDSAEEEKFTKPASTTWAEST